MNNYEVIIVGAGPTGLMAANLLGSYNIKTLVIEKKPSTSQIPKAIVIDDEGMRICQSVGLAEAVEKIITSGGGAQYFTDVNTKPFAIVKPPYVGAYGYSARNKFLQSEFEDVLLKGVYRFPNIDVLFNTSLVCFEQSEHYVKIKSINNITHEEMTFTAEYLLGCDGGRSTVRKNLGIKLEDIGNKKTGSSFEEPWIIVDLKNDTLPSRHTSFFCNPPRPSMHAATGAGQRRYEFMLLDGEDEDELLKDENLARIMAPYVDYKPENLVKKAVVRFNALVAEKFQEGRIILLGDSIHMTPPFAGQGLNSGLRDAYNMCWKVVSVLKGLLDPVILDSYEDERRDHIKSMIKLAVTMGNFILTTSTKRKLFRDAAFLLMSVVPPLKQYVTEMRFKPKPICTEGLFIDVDPDRKSLVGEMIQQPRVLSEDTSFKLLDHVLGSDFSLVKVGKPEEIQFPPLAKGIWANLNVKKVSAVPFDYLPHSQDGEEVFTDVSELFKDFQNKFILIRPDRYIAGIFSEEEFDSFTKKLSEVYKPGNGKETISQPTEVANYS